jgi:hypothetical protein
MGTEKKIYDYLDSLSPINTKEKLDSIVNMVFEISKHSDIDLGKIKGELLYSMKKIKLQKELLNQFKELELDELIWAKERERSVILHKEKIKQQELNDFRNELKKKKHRSDLRKRRNESIKTKNKKIYDDFKINHPIEKQGYLGNEIIKMSKEEERVQKRLLENKALPKVFHSESEEDPLHKK